MVSDNFEKGLHIAWKFSGGRLKTFLAEIILSSPGMQYNLLIKGLGPGDVEAKNQKLVQ